VNISPLEASYLAEMATEMHTSKQNHGSRFLIFLVGLLLVAVGVQSYFLARLHGPERAGPGGLVPDSRAAPSSQLQLVPKDEPPSDQPVPQVRPSIPQNKIDPKDSMDLFFGRNAGDLDNPFQAMEAMRERVNRMMDGAFGPSQTRPGSSRFMPHTDVRDDGENYVLRFDLPGAEETDISVDLQDRTLTVSGDTSEEIKESVQGRVIRTERRSGRFQRSIMLPGKVDTEKMNAEYHDGVLTVTIPKMEGIPAKRSMTI